MLRAATGSRKSAPAPPPELIPFEALHLPGGVHRHHDAAHVRPHLVRAHADRLGRLALAPADQVFQFRVLCVQAVTCVKRRPGPSLLVPFQVQQDGARRAAPEISERNARCTGSDQEGLPAPRLPPRGLRDAFGFPCCFSSALSPFCGIIDVTPLLNSCCTSRSAIMAIT